MNIEEHKYTRYFRAVSLRLIDEERDRQETLKQEGRFRHTPFDAAMQEPEKLACILEECGEVARNTLSRSYLVTDGERTDEALLKELIQIAALASAWAERLIANREGDVGFHGLVPGASDDIVSLDADVDEMQRLDREGRERARGRGPFKG